MISSREVLNLYRNLLRSGKKFSNYNFREYALRRTKEDFRANRSASDPVKIAELVSHGNEELAVIQRQAALSMMFSPGVKYVIENRKD